MPIPFFGFSQQLHALEQDLLRQRGLRLAEL